LWIAFRSDGSVEYCGFRATFYFIDGALRLRLDAYGTVRAVWVRFGYVTVTLRYVTWGWKTDITPLQGGYLANYASKYVNIIFRSVRWPTKTESQAQEEGL